jgi:hypothetical protein
MLIEGEHAAVQPAGGRDWRIVTSPTLPQSGNGRAPSDSPVATPTTRWRHRTSRTSRARHGVFSVGSAPLRAAHASDARQRNPRDQEAGGRLQAPRLRHPRARRPIVPCRVVVANRATAAELPRFGGRGGVPRALRQGCTQYATRLPPNEAPPLPDPRCARCEQRCSFCGTPSFRCSTWYPT